MAKIVHLTSVHAANDARIFYKECKSLARAGYDVSLVVPHERDEFNSGVRIIGTRRIASRLVRMCRTPWRVYRLALDQNADIYHFHDPELIPIGLLLLLQGKTVIYDVHEDLPRTICDKPYIPRLLRWPLSLISEVLENFAVKKFSATVPATNAIGERFSKLSPRSVVVRNFPTFEAPQTQLAWEDRPHAIAYAGGIFPSRGIGKLIEALALLPAKLNPSLELAGWYSPEDFREELITLPGWNRVREHGVLDRAGVADLLGRVRAGLVLYEPLSNHLRAEPHKLFEYMAAGIPVIASDTPFWREIVEEAKCGMVVDPLNPRAIAQKIEYVLTHPDDAQQMGCRGVIAVQQHYNWTNEEQKFLQLYEDLLGKGAKSRPCEFGYTQSYTLHS